VMPVEVDGKNSGRLLSEVFDNRKSLILNPFHAHVYDLGRNVMTLEKIGQSEEPHGKEVDPDEVTDRPVVIRELGDMEKNTVKCSHRANCKMPTRNISTLSQKNRMMHSVFRNLGIPGFGNSKFLNSQIP